MSQSGGFPAAAPAAIAMADKLVKESYAAFGRKDIPALMELFRDDTTWFHNLDDDFVKRVPFYEKLVGKKNIVKFFTELLPKFFKIEVFDIKSFTTGSYATKSGQAAPRIIVAVFISGVVNSTGKRYHEMEYHIYNFNPEGNHLLACEINLDTLAAVDAYTPSDSHAPSASVLETARNTLLGAYAAFGKGDVESLLKVFADDVQFDLDSGISRAIIGRCFTPGTGLENVRRFFTDMSKHVAVTKFVPKSVNVGVTQHAYHGKTAARPYVFAIIDLEFNQVGSGKKHDNPLEGHESVWNEEGTKIIYFNHRQDTAKEWTKWHSK